MPFDPLSEDFAWEKAIPDNRKSLILESITQFKDIPATAGKWNMDSLLYAVLGCESFFGLYTGFKQEGSYLPGGRYFSQALYNKYGNWVTGSWGWFQIMGPTMYELGFSLIRPELYNDPRVQVMVAEKYIRVRAAKALTVEHVARAYNGGSITSNTYADWYIPYFEAYYDEWEIIKWRVRMDDQDALNKKLGIAASVIGIASALLYN